MKNILIFGVGLIGGSLSLALKHANKKLIITGAGRSQSSLQVALNLGIIDQVATDIPTAVACADVIIIAAPVAQTPAILAQIKPYCQSHTVITDCGSTKSDVAQYAVNVLAEKSSQFVPAHPIAGAEKTGPEAAMVDLYIGKNVIITPDASTNQAAVDTVTSMWQLTGALVSHMTCAEHDAIFASVSHLPHLLAFALVDELASRPNAETLFKFAASGFRDFTRIAGSHPEMWRDISLANKTGLISEISAFELELNKLKTALKNEDADTLLSLFERASVARNAWQKARE